ncbi:retrograde regulation protein 2 [Purpureocillium lilacinum]|uniref:Retrograde regulation protein 2 n=1 Tax=Purpureocillium lilacinum TaxID=33203 RepID=A0A179F3T3_PURLI|nr:retrograde regulation protein 2 [Purpureocillium lilacinum]OAQ60084.1 retrograde regulation protein 2 [Purpureocillium lilacinum]
MATDLESHKEPSVEDHELQIAKTEQSNSMASQYESCIALFTPAEQKSIIRRIDCRLVSTLGFLYAVSLMDRNNTGIAMIAGMSVDLEMIGNRYSLVVLLFFVPYVLFQPPVTVLLRKIGPKPFLAATTLVWGLATIASGFVKSWSDLIPLRLILGFHDVTGTLLILRYHPGCAYLLSCWYPRYDLQKRNAVFYMIGTTLSAFSGILALGFSQLEGRGAGPQWWGRVQAVVGGGNSKGDGISGWRWIFILQGTLTCIIAFAAYILVLGFPDVKETTCGFHLSNREAAFVVARIEFNFREYLSHALDIKIWGFAALFGLTTVNTYAIAYFLPLILRNGMGFSVAASQCLVAPPYVAAGLTMFLFAYLSDKYRVRSPFILFNGCLLLIGERSSVGPESFNISLNEPGLPLLGFVENTGVRYLGAFITTTACNANVPCILTWQANNIRGQWKRAFCSATLVGTGGIGGIVGTTVFRSQDSPTYRPGMYATIAASALIIIITLLLDWKLSRANKRAASGGRPVAALDGFRYTL